jgi:hypothetical protein
MSPSRWISFVVGVVTVATIGVAGTRAPVFDPRGLDLPEASRRLESGAMVLPTWTAHSTLTAFLNAEKTRVDNEGPNENTFVTLTNAEIAEAAIGIHQLMVGDLEAGAVGMQRFGYEVYQFNPAGQLYVLVREPTSPPTGFRGLGTMVLNLRPRRAITVTGTHVTTDTNSDVTSREMFVSSEAWLLYWSGTERCNATTLSTCTGTTGLCSGGTTAYRISDPTGYNRSMMQAVGVASRNADVDLIADMHSNVSDIVNLTLGAGGPQDRPAQPETLLSNRVRNRLVTESAPFTLASCNSASDDRDALAFCGNINPIGRYMNGVSHIGSCTSYATTPNGRFMQIEMQSTVYNSSTNRNLVIDAVKAEVAARW